MTTLTQVQFFQVGDSDSDSPPYVQRPQTPDVVMRGPGGETHRIAREYENLIALFMAAGWRCVDPETEGQQP